jgi:hypothetical protein
MDQFEKIYFIALLSILISLSAFIFGLFTNNRRIFRNFMKKVEVRRIEKKGNVISQISLYRERIIDELSRINDDIFGSYYFNQIYVPLDVQMPNKITENPEIVIRQNRLVSILGAPGTGKTTLLRHLKFKIASGGIEGVPDLPVFVSLVNYSQLFPSFESFLLNSISETYGINFRIDDFVKLLKKGFIILLLDGLDEIGTNHNLRNGFITKLNEFSESYVKTPIIITCRNTNWNDNLPDFLLTNIEPLNEVKIREFIFNRLSNNSVALSEELYFSIYNSYSLLDLAKIPLFLSLITNLYEKNHKTSFNKYQLFKDFTDYLLRKWDEKRGIRRDSLFESRYKEIVLRDIAEKMTVQNENKISKTELFESIEAEFPKKSFSNPKDVVDEIIQSSGLLRIVNHNFYSFSHRSIQDYFTAIKISQPSDMQKKYFQKIVDQTWREIFIFICAKGDGRPIIENLLLNLSRGRKNSNYSYLLFLAADCIKESPNPDQTQKEFILKTLIENYSYYKDIRYKQKIARLINSIDKQFSEEFLWNLFNSKNSEDKAISSLIISINKDNEKMIIDQLIFMLLSGPAYLKKESILRLGYLNRIETIEMLLSVIQLEKDIEVKHDSMYSIKNIISNNNKIDYTLMPYFIKEIKKISAKENDEIITNVSNEIISQLVNRIQE